jgi:PHS family inorganic phosphate transporter-like MFS transporter
MRIHATRVSRTPTTWENLTGAPQIISLISPRASQTETIAIQLAIFAVAAVPGYLLAIARMDRIGHRRLQLAGFILMGACFAVIGLVPGMTTAVVPFLLAYGISYFFTEFGPNVTTFVLPGELFPTRLRATGHGISARVGELGAFIGVFLFHVLQSSLGLRATLLLTAGISALGALLTLVLPEPAGRTYRKSPARPTSSQKPSKRPATPSRSSDAERTAGLYPIPLSALYLCAHHRRT